MIDLSIDYTSPEDVYEHYVYLFSNDFSEGIWRSIYDRIKEDLESYSRKEGNDRVKDLERFLSEVSEKLLTIITSIKPFIVRDWVREAFIKAVQRIHTAYIIESESDFMRCVACFLSLEWDAVIRESHHNLADLFIKSYQDQLLQDLYGFVGSRGSAQKALHKVFMDCRPNIFTCEVDPEDIERMIRDSTRHLESMTSLRLCPDGYRRLLRNKNRFDS